MNTNVYSLQTLQKIFATMAVFALVFSPFINVQFASADVFDPINTEDGAYNNPSDNVTICHTGSGKNYVNNSVSADSIVSGTSGHGDQHSLDIIPSFWHILPGGSTATLYSGRNWDTVENVAIWEAACAGDDSATINLIKEVTNEPGANLGQFTLTIDGDEYESGESVFVAIDSSGGDNITVTETSIPSGYTQTGVSCTDGKTTNSDSVSVSPKIKAGEEWTCTITNQKNPAPATITITKKVIKDDNDGPEDADSFTYRIDGNAVTEGDMHEVSAGQHTLSEDIFPGYTASDWGGNCNADGSITTVAGTDYECTITNDDVYTPPDRAKITVTKVVTNDDGGTLEVSDFPLFVGDTRVTSGVAHEVFSAGDYKISETNQTGYSAGDWGGDCAADGSLSGVVLGQSYTCTITNDDIAPKLTVTKTVTNDDSGTLGVSDFPLFVNATQVTSGVQNEFSAGNYVVSETGDSGYTGAISGDCDANGNISLAVGDVKSCTITNDDNDPTEANITITKSVVNDDGGTLGVSDFPLFVGATQVTSGVAHTVFSAGDYAISETNQTGYSAGDWGGDCAADGSLSGVVLGQSYTCTITNDDDPVICDDRSANNYEEEGECTYDPVCEYLPEYPDNLLVNGSFEKPTPDEDWSSYSGGKYKIFTDILGWTATQGIELWNNMFNGASDGEQNVELDVVDATKITQNVATIPGATYELRFDFAARTADSADNHIEAAYDGISLVSTSTDNTEWVTYSQTFVADGSTDISFEDLGTPQAKGGTGTLLDNAVLCLVEEPQREIPGCTDPEANNYDPEATVENQSCTYGGGGGGGGSSSPRCDAFELDGDVLSWETTRGRDLEITLNGSEVFSTTNDDVVEEGTFDLASEDISYEGGDKFELTVFRGSKSRTCKINLPARAGEVLGAETEILPLGAPDTGAGGTSPVVPSLPSLLAILALGGRRSKNA